MSSQAGQLETQIGIEEILSILPHRYPFLLVDRILSIDLKAKKIVGLKNLTMNEPFFQGHFPNQPIFPGVLMLESMAQVGGILMEKLGFQGLKMLMSIYKAKFRKIVRPGDQLILDVEVTHFSQRGGKTLAKALVLDQIVAEAEISFVIEK